ncbi:MAG TPA: hypothetical protein VNS34_26585 [Rhizobiaceae bacterium]|nr:hypothetical protein [Rhizobiaceae bacterium]
MDSLQIQDVFDPYYVGRKPFMSKRLRPRAAEPRKGSSERKATDRDDSGDTRDPGEALES